MLERKAERMWTASSKGGLDTLVPCRSREEGLTTGFRGTCRQTRDGGGLPEGEGIPPGITHDLVLQFDLPARRMEREENEKSLLAENRGDVDKTLYYLSRRHGDSRLGGHDARFLLAHGANANSGSNEDCLTLVERAARNGNSSVVAALLDAGASDIGKALRWAAGDGRNAVVTLLLDRGADVHYADDIALLCAGRGGHLDTTALLLQRGATLTNEILAETEKLGHHAVADMMRAHALLDCDSNIHFRNGDVLIDAARKGHLAATKLLLNWGADVHAQDDKALCLAAENGALEVVKLLLDRGARVHAQEDKPLALAAQNIHLETVAHLLDRGADVHARGDYALRVAVASRRFEGLEVVRLLLDRGADVHADNDWALRITAHSHYSRLLALLLDRGANVHADGDYSLQLAAQRGSSDMVAILLDGGANIHAEDGFALRVAWQEFNKKRATNYADVMAQLILRGALR